MAQLMYIESPYIFIFRSYDLIHNVHQIVECLNDINKNKLSSLIKSYGNVDLRFTDVVKNYRFKNKYINKKFEGTFMFPKNLDVFSDLPKGLQLIEFTKKNGIKYFYDENNKLITSYKYRDVEPHPILE